MTPARRIAWTGKLGSSSMAGVCAASISINRQNLIFVEDTTATSFRISYGYDPAFSSDLLDQLITDPDRVVDTEAHMMKHDRTTTVALIEEGNVRWIIKRYNTKNLWHALRRTVRHSRALNCWEMSKHFGQIGISIPRPVAYIEKRFGPLRGKSYFINEYIEAENIFTYITTHPDPATTKTTEQKVVELFEALRTTGINHGDMKATNLLVRNQGTPAGAPAGSPVHQAAWPRR